MGANNFLLLIFILITNTVFSQNSNYDLLKKNHLYQKSYNEYSVTREFDMNNDSLLDIIYCYEKKGSKIDTSITEIYSVKPDSTLILLYRFNNLFALRCSNSSNKNICDSVRYLYINQDNCRPIFDNKKITMTFYVESTTKIEIDFTYTPKGYFSTRQRQYLDNPVTKDITLDYEVPIAIEDGIYLQDFEFPEPL